MVVVCEKDSSRRKTVTSNCAWIEGLKCVQHEYIEAQLWPFWRRTGQQCRRTAGNRQMDTRTVAEHGLMVAQQQAYVKTVRQRFCVGL